MRKEESTRTVPGDFVFLIKWLERREGLPAYDAVEDIQRYFLSFISLLLKHPCRKTAQKEK